MTHKKAGFLLTMLGKVLAAGVALGTGFGGGDENMGYSHFRGDDDV